MDMQDCIIRRIEPRDDSAVESIIRGCLVEYGGDHGGTAWTDPMLGHFSQVYSAEGSCYWVAEDSRGRIVGGVGIGGLEGTDGICELQKMYLLREARGNGIAGRLLKIALTFAKGRYRSCYLETLPNMTEAQRFYEKHGFVRVSEPVTVTEHFACDIRYILYFD